MSIGKILLVGRNEKTYLFRRIKEEAVELGFDVFTTSYNKVEVSIDKVIALRLENIPLSNLPKAILLTAPGNYAAMHDFLVNFFLEQGLILLNGQSHQRWQVLDKLTQNYELQRAGIPFIPSKVFGNLSRLWTTIKTENKPTILKYMWGAGGTSVFKVSTAQDLFLALQFYKPHEWLVQETLVASAEFRVIVLGNQVLGSVKKLPLDGEFRANWRLGATLQPTKIPSFIEELAIRSCAALKCDFAGVDILCTGAIESQENCRVLEVNRYFGFEGFEQATGINVTAKLLKWISTQLEHSTQD